jgi:ATP-dependent Clp protease adaptor protein ClpS
MRVRTERGPLNNSSVPRPDENTEMTMQLSSTRPGVRRLLERPVARMPLYKVLLHNDDINTMEHVVTALAKVFKFERSICERIMIEAHTNRVALCAVEPFEPAELHRDRLRSYSLIATIEPE